MFLILGISDLNNP